jgi:hypothetical protein
LPAARLGRHGTPTRRADRQTAPALIKQTTQLPGRKRPFPNGPSRGLITLPDRVENSCQTCWPESASSTVSRSSMSSSTSSPSSSCGHTPEGPNRRRPRPQGRWRHERRHHPEHVGDTAGRCPAGKPRRPPGRQTRPSSRATARWLGANYVPRRWSRRRSSDQPSVSARTDVRQMLCSSRPAVSNLSAASPYAASRRPAVPGSVTLVSRANVVPCKAASDLAKGRAWPDTEEVTGSNPVAPTIETVTSINAHDRCLLTGSLSHIAAGMSPHSGQEHSTC